MDLVGDRRAQSVQVGAVLLFAVLVVAFSSYQAFVVPQQNEEIEFNHNQRVHTQMQDLRNAIVSQVGGGSSASVSVTLGTNYPSRAVAVNPGPPSGSLRTNGTVDASKDLTLSNAVASGETGDLWDGSPRRYNTGTLVYEPNYNLYGSAPTTYYEHSVAYNQFRSDALPLSGQTLVEGRRISLVALNGSLGRSSSGTTTVDVEPVSQSTRTVTVTDDGTNPVSVSLLTRLSPTQVQGLLDEEYDPGGTDPDAYVTSVSKTGENGPFNNVTIAFESGVDYRLQMAKVGVGSRVTDEEDAYVTVVDSGDATVTQSGETEIVLEVRDAYNNPVEGVTVEASDNSSSPGSFADTTRSTDQDGRVTFTYNTDGPTATTPHQLNFTTTEAITGDAAVTPNLGSFDAGDPKNVTRTVTVESESTGLPAGSVSLVSALAKDDDDADGDGDANTVPGGVDLSFQNTYNKEITVTDIDIRPADTTIDALADESAGIGPTDNEYYVDGDVQDAYVDFSQFSSGFSGRDGVSLPRETDLDIDGRINADNARVSAGTTFTAYLYEFYRYDEGSGTASNVDMRGEQLLVSLTYTVDSVVYERTYTVSPADTSGSFSSTRATGLVPNAKQEQTLTFTPSTTLPAGTTVTINLDDPQTVSPLQVDYGSASIASAGGGSATWVSQSDDDRTRIEYTPSSDVAAGTQVSIRLTDVIAGDQSDQSNPYSVPFTRADTGNTVTDDFSVTRGAGTSALDSVSVDDLDPNTGSQTQQISFSPTSGTTLPNGETVYVDLSNAQGADDVNYGSASATVAGGGGSVQFLEQGSDVVLQYTSDGATDGDIITLELTGVSTGSGANSPYTVGLSRSDADTAGTTFAVSSPSVQNGIRYEGGLTTTGSNSAVQFEISNSDSNFARIQAVSITARNGVSGEIYNDGPREIDISGGDSDGYEDVDGNPTSRALSADGSRIDLDQNAVLSTTGGGSSAVVFVGQFGTASGNTFTQYDFTGLTKVTSSDNWDVRVTIELQNRGDVVYYFQET
ncbi:hypothetical protein [Haloarcula pellucida]|uniref:Big-1 domain-containing protein n=1 Tax=Haloarcula pellucida TaxID=1427151 RepID=A0A830GPD2_9EURY|nr:hypothetical protein [Halomicroarcula pellucida]MBX0348293.1 hypothetical protein [Halomicroarcula pellucida]GGN97878.1 hypothetical protein GCM10009030_27620 [Halomicroarcula pellucida]